MLLNSVKAALIDKKLMSPEYGYTLEQLMELAGLSCALAINQQYKSKSEILIIAGPGNNGGDGLVCARHLKILGWNPTVYYPNAEKMYAKQPFYNNLVTTLEKMYEIKVIKDSLGKEQLNMLFKQHKYIVDSIFGFSFKPPIKQGQYLDIINLLIENQKKRADIQLISIDSPSGWDVDEGPKTEDYLDPDMLISLTYPKLCSKYLKPTSQHYCGGRFISKKFASEFGIVPLSYQEASLIVKL
jgi:NAD(P)H-hydrate epimerase